MNILRHKKENNEVAIKRVKYIQKKLKIKQKKELSLALKELETVRKRICALCLGQKIRTQ